MSWRIENDMSKCSIEYGKNNWKIQTLSSVKFYLYSNGCHSNEKKNIIQYFIISIPLGRILNFQTPMLLYAIKPLHFEYVLKIIYPTSNILSELLNSNMKDI